MVELFKRTVAYKIIAGDKESNQLSHAYAFICEDGAILPSFIIILIIVAVIRNLLKYAGVKAVLKSFHPAIAGMILATSVLKEIYLA